MRPCVDLKDYEDLLLAENEKLEKAMTLAQNLNWNSFEKRMLSSHSISIGSDICLHGYRFIEATASLWFDFVSFFNGLKVEELFSRHAFGDYTPKFTIPWYSV